MQHPVITLYKVYAKIFPLPHPPVFLTKIVWIVHVSVNKCRSYPGRGDFLLSCPVPHCYGVIFIVLDWCKIFSLASLMKTNTKYSVTRSIACDHHGTHKRMLRLAEQGWHSGEDACLSPMWRRFESWTRRLTVKIICVHRWYSTLLQGFSAGFSSFPSSNKTIIPNSNSISTNEHFILSEFIWAFPYFVSK